MLKHNMDDVTLHVEPRRITRGNNGWETVSKLWAARIEPLLQENRQRIAKEAEDAQNAAERLVADANTAIPSIEITAGSGQALISTPVATQQALTQSCFR
jgi:hypothetical protein